MLQILFLLMLKYNFIRKKCEIYWASAFWKYFLVLLFRVKDENLKPFMLDKQNFNLL